MLRPFLASALLCLATVAHAQNYYEFQREIQHRRDFAKEMESLASRPNAPSKNFGKNNPGKSEMDTWLEGKKAAEEAWRNQRAAAARAAASAKREEAERRAAQQREYRAREAIQQTWYAEIATVARGFEQEGFDPVDSEMVAFNTTPRADGSILSSPAFVRMVGDAQRHLARFRHNVDTAPYPELLESLSYIQRGTTRADESSRIGLVTYFEFGERLLQRFPNEAFGRQLAQEMAKLLLQPEHTNNRYYKSRPKVAALYAKVVRYAPLEGLKVAQAVAQGSSRWSVPPLPEAAIPILEATYAATWAVAAAQAPGDEAADDSVAAAHFDAAYHCALELARIHEQAPDLAAAARWYARTLKATNRSVTAKGQIPAAVFFEADASRLNQLDAATFQELARGLPSLYSVPLARAIATRALREPLPDQAEFLLRAALRLDDWALAQEALYLNAGPEWAVPQNLAGTVQVLRAMVNAPPVEAFARVIYARARALQAAYAGTSVETRLQIADEAAALGAWEGRYARAYLLSLQGTPTPAQREEGLALFRALAAEGLTAPWENRVGAPHPLCFAAYALGFDRTDPERMTEVRRLYESILDLPTTQFYYGRFLLSRAEFSAADRARGRELLERAAQQGVLIAHAELGAVILQARKTPADDASALSHLLAGLRTQNARGMLALGIAYSQGWGTSPDLARALELFENVAGGGADQAQALRRAALLHTAKQGLPFNPVRGFELAVRATEMGDKYAPAHAGTLIYRGEAPEHPKSEALTWWRKGAERGDIAAARNIYKTLLLGDVVPKDEAAAVAELGQFLEKASPEIQYFGARVLLDDHPTYPKIGVARPVEGERWLSRAAEKSPRAAEYRKARLAAAGAPAHVPDPDSPPGA